MEQYRLRERCDGARPPGGQPRRVASEGSPHWEGMIMKMSYCVCLLTGCRLCSIPRFSTFRATERFTASPPAESFAAGPDHRMLTSEPYTLF